MIYTGVTVTPHHLALLRGDPAGAALRLLLRQRQRLEEELVPGERRVLGPTATLPRSLDVVRDGADQGVCKTAASLSRHAAGRDGTGRTRRVTVTGGSAGPVWTTWQIYGTEPE